MKSLTNLLQEAAIQFQSQVADRQPSFENISLVFDAQQKSQEDWSFYTDLEKIYANLFNEKTLTRKLGYAADYFKAFLLSRVDLNQLILEMFDYILWHELHHFFEGPISCKGDINDQKSIRQAIRRGVVQAQPELTAAQQLMKVSYSENMIMDLLGDTRLASDNYGYFRPEIMLLPHIVELMNMDSTGKISYKEPKLNMYRVTRYMYAMMIGNVKQKELFYLMATPKGVEVANDAFRAILTEGLEEPLLLQSLRAKLNGVERYTCIETLMSILGPYVDIKEGEPDGGSCRRRTPDEDKTHSSVENIIDDLLEDMTPGENQEFVRQLIQGYHRANLPQDIQTEIKLLNSKLRHDYYLKYHPEVKVPGEKEAISRVHHKQSEIIRPVKISIVDQYQLASMPVTQIMLFQAQTGIPMIIPIQDNLFLVYEYAIKNVPLPKAIIEKEESFVPREVIFYLDSSGTMYDGKSGFMDGTRWDMLCHVLYGFIDGLSQASKIRNEQCTAQIFNFASTQVASRVFNLQDFIRGDKDILRALYEPENGYNTYLNINEVDDAKKRDYVIITDGDLNGDLETEIKKIVNLATNPQNRVILFEIGGTYSLGRAVQSIPGVYYFKVHNKEEMLARGLSVLLSKTSADINQLYTNR
ncbi:MAG: hypothetical protein ABIJ34_09060 [archaeon]